jgi:RNA polymerase sigma-70 factor (ECF subfamily)
MGEPESLSAVLLERLGVTDAARAEAGADARRLDDRLEGMLGAARARWPSLSLGASDFVAYLAERVEPSNRGDAAAAIREIDAALSRLRAEDLFLACACAGGDAGAIAAFEAAFFADADGALARVGTRGAAIDDVKQTLRSKLFVGEPGARPKIAEYSGRGDLKSWFRVVAVRQAISGARKTRREVGLDEEMAEAVPGASSDPELVYLRAKYRAEFQDAFRGAIDALSVQERNLLRHHYIDRLSIDRIGAIYRIHRMTAARRLTAIREKLVESTRRRLADHLALDTAELASVLRLVQSDADVTLRRYLGEKAS